MAELHHFMQLPVAVDRSSSDSVVIRYVLPILRGWRVFT